MSDLLVIFFGSMMLAAGFFGGWYIASDRAYHEKQALFAEWSLSNERWAVTCRSVIDEFQRSSAAHQSNIDKLVKVLQ